MHAQRKGWPVLSLTQTSLLRMPADLRRPSPQSHPAGGKQGGMLTEPQRNSPREIMRHRPVKKHWRQWLTYTHTMSSFQGQTLVGVVPTLSAGVSSLGYPCRPRHSQGTPPEVHPGEQPPGRNHPRRAGRHADRHPERSSPKTNHAIGPSNPPAARQWLVCLYSGSHRSQYSLQDRARNCTRKSDTDGVGTQVLWQPQRLILPMAGCGA